MTHEAFDQHIEEYTISLIAAIADGRCGEIDTTDHVLMEEQCVEDLLDRGVITEEEAEAL